MPVDRIAAGHAERQVGLGRRTATALTELWKRVEPGNILSSWRVLLTDALVVLGTSQATAAASAGTYVDDVMGDYGLTPQVEGRVLPAAFAGIASDGRPLASLLARPAVTALAQIGRGVPTPQALMSGQFALDMIARTQVADAGRTAVGVALVARPQLTGYVRMVVGSTCSRCIILAGRVYEWNEGFERHPRCDCRHIPVAENAPGDVSTNPRAYFDSLTTEEQDKVFGVAGAQAIREGADMARVVNARRGMVTADGRLYTTEAAGRRPRLMPEQIYRDAKNREDAIRLLKLHRYIT